MNAGQHERLKVLFVIDKWQAGGRQRVLQKLIDGLDRAGFEPSLLVLSEVTSPFPLPKARVLTLPAARFRSTILPLARILRSERPDIISSHLGVLAAPLVYLAALVSRTRSAVVFTIQSIFDLRSYARTRFPRVQKFFISLTLRSAAFITVASERMRARLSEEFGVPPQRMRALPNPAYERAAEPRHRPNAPRGEVRILSVGRLAYPKDFSTLLKSFAKARADSPVPLSLFIIGDGQERDELRAEARSLGLDESIFKGEALVGRDTFEAADIFVLCSRSEGMPTVLIEALAAGVPVIASDCDFGPRDVIKDGENGLLVPVGDAEKLADAIVRLARDTELRHAFRDAGPRAVERFEVRAAVGAWQTLFRSIAHD